MTYNGQPITSSGIEVARVSDAELEVALGRTAASVDVKAPAAGKSRVVAVATDAAVERFGK